MRPRRSALVIASSALVVLGCGTVLDADDDPATGPAPSDDASVDRSSDGAGATDGGGASDGDGDGAATKGDGEAGANPCGTGCAAGTTCTSSGCHVDGEPGCTNNGTAPIEVAETGGRFYGKICAATTPAELICSSAKPEVHAHVFHFAGTGQYALSFKTTSLTMKSNVVDSSCTTAVGNGCDTTGAGATVGATLQGGEYFALGFEGTTGCTDYNLLVTPK